MAGVSSSRPRDDRLCTGVAKTRPQPPEPDHWAKGFLRKPLLCLSFCVLCGESSSGDRGAMAEPRELLTLNLERALRWAAIHRVVGLPSVALAGLVPSEAVVGAPRARFTGATAALQRGSARGQGASAG